MKQFIRNVRASKTIADERAVVQKESAAIRASFREESGDSNVRFVEKGQSGEDVLMSLIGGTMSPSSSICLRSANGHTSDKSSV